MTFAQIVMSLSMMLCTVVQVVGSKTRVYLT